MTAVATPWQWSVMPATSWRLNIYLLGHLFPVCNNILSSNNTNTKTCTMLLPVIKEQPLKQLMEKHIFLVSKNFVGPKAFPKNLFRYLVWSWKEAETVLLSVSLPFPSHLFWVSFSLIIRHKFSWQGQHLDVFWNWHGDLLMFWGFGSDALLLLLEPKD